MKNLLRATAVTAALALAAFGLTGCADEDDDCDSAGTVSVQYAPAAYGQPVAGKGGGKSRGSKSKPKPKKPKSAHYDSDDCDDEMED